MIAEEVAVIAAEAVADKQCSYLFQEADSLESASCFLLEVKGEQEDKGRVASLLLLHFSFTVLRQEKGEINKWLTCDRRQLLL